MVCNFKPPCYQDWFNLMFKGWLLALSPFMTIIYIMIQKLNEQKTLLYHVGQRCGKYLHLQKKCNEYDLETLKMLPISMSWIFGHLSNMKERYWEMAMGDDGASTSAKELQQMRGPRDEERFYNTRF